MPCADVFSPFRVGAPAQGMSDPDALSSRKSQVLVAVPAVGLAEVVALFYDSFHDVSLPDFADFSSEW